MRMKRRSASLCLGLCLSWGTVLQAADFDPGLGDLKVTWVTNVTAALGFRTKTPSCSLTGDPNSVGQALACGSSANTSLWANGDDGNLVEINPSTRQQVATSLVDNSGNPPGSGALFGLMATPVGVYFVDDATNSFNLLH